jgi:hypothetical protein
VAAGVALFLASRLLTGGPSMAALVQESVPLELALSNGKPTVVEFYAGWWVGCRGARGCCAATQAPHAPAAPRAERGLRRTCVFWVCVVHTLQV